MAHAFNPASLLSRAGRSSLLMGTLMVVVVGVVLALSGCASGAPPEAGKSESRIASSSGSTSSSSVEPSAGQAETTRPGVVPSPSVSGPTSRPDTIPTAPAGGAVGAGREGFAVVGDSLTAGAAAIVDGSRPGVGSWVGAADVAPLSFQGGWAVPGATTTDMLAWAPPAPQRADLVVLAGTNDLLRGGDTATVLGNLAAIVDRSEADEVLVVALPPLDSNPTAVEEYNPQLATLAQSRGWLFVDPWSDLRTDGEYTVGTTVDGVHPTPEVADLVGARIRSALLYGGPA